MTASVTTLKVQATRVGLLRVDESTDDLRAEVHVTLSRNGDDVVGHATGVPADSERAGLVAAATLDAISTPDQHFVLLDTLVTHCGGTAIAMVVVTNPDEDRPLVGTAVIDDENRQVAFAKATLDALNRKLS